MQLLQSLLLAASLSLLHLSALANPLPEFSDAYLDTAAKKHGEDAGKRLLAWKRLIEDQRHKNERDKIEAVNAFWNRVPYLRTDRRTWPTPAQMLATNGGACTEYAIGKYLTLVAMGVDAERLLLGIAQVDRAPDSWNPPDFADSAHMVLIYTPHNGRALVLDNNTPFILHLQYRRDLVLVNAFHWIDIKSLRNFFSPRFPEGHDVRIWAEQQLKRAADVMSRIGKEFK